MADERREHRRRSGKPGGLEHHHGQARDPARMQAVEEIGQRVDEFAAHRAAQASVGQLDDAVGGRLDDEMVNRDVSERVDDDGPVVYSGSDPVVDRDRGGVGEPEGDRDGGVRWG